MISINLNMVNKVTSYFIITIPSLFLLISLMWIIHFFLKIKRTSSEITNLKSRPPDPENDLRLFRYKNRIYKSFLFLYYTIMEVLYVSSLILENSFDLTDAKNSTIAGGNCIIHKGSYLHIRYESKYAYVMAIRKGLIVYSALLFVLILFYFNNIYKFKEKFRHSTKQVLWLFITFLPAVIVAITTLFPWTILFDWVLNAFILEVSYFVGIYYAKILNRQLRMQQQDLEHVDNSNTTILKTHSQIIKQYLVFIKPIFIMAQYLLLSKVLDEFVKEFVGTVILNNCWIEETFKIRLNLIISSETEKIFSIVSQVVNANITLAIVLFVVTLIVLNLKFVCNKIISNRKVYKTHYKSSTPLLGNYKGIV